MIDFWERWPTIQEDWERRHGCRDFLAAYLHVAPEFGHYVMSTPNEFVWSIDDLMFGKRDYDVREIQTQDFHWKKYQKPENWREVASDKWAMRHVCEDVSGVLSGRHQRNLIFDPFLLEEVLRESPDVVNSVRAVVNDGFRLSSFKPLNKAVSAVLRGKYREVYHHFMQQPETWRERTVGAYSNDPWDVRWNQVLRQFEQCSNLICQYIARDYTVNPELWTMSVVKYANLSAEKKAMGSFKPFFQRPKMIPIKREPPSP